MKLFELIGFGPLTSDMNLARELGHGQSCGLGFGEKDLKEDKYIGWLLCSCSKLVGQIIRLVVECLEQTLGLLLELIEELIRQY